MASNFTVSTPLLRYSYVIYTPAAAERRFGNPANVLYSQSTIIYTVYVTVVKRRPLSRVGPHLHLHRTGRGALHTLPTSWPPP